MLNSKKLDVMKDVEITATDYQALVDISKIHIDPAKTAEEKMRSFLGQVKNPYCFRCGDTPVRIRFVSEKRTVTEALGNYFKSLK